MFIKVTTRYRDKELDAELPAGVILDVTDERAEVIIKAGKAEEFKFPAHKPNKKSDKVEEKGETVQEDKAEEVPEVATEEVVTEETPAEETTEVVPEATETTGE